MIRQVPRLPVGHLPTDLALEAHRESINDVAGKPIVNGVLMADLLIPENATVRFNHGLGRAYRMLILSPVVTTSSAVGEITEIRDGIDKTTQFALHANGYNADVKVSVWVL